MNRAGCNQEAGRLLTINAAVLDDRPSFSTAELAQINTRQQARQVVAAPADQVRLLRDEPGTP